MKKERIPSADWVKITILYIALLVVAIVGYFFAHNWADGAFYILAIAFVSFVLGYLKGG